MLDCMQFLQDSFLAFIYIKRKIDSLAELLVKKVIESPGARGSRETGSWLVGRREVRGPYEFCSYFVFRTRHFQEFKSGQSASCFC